MMEAHPFCEQTFLRLAEESQEKVEYIFAIAALLAHHGVAPICASDFNRMYDGPVQELIDYIGEIRAVLGS